MKIYNRREGKHVKKRKIFNLQKNRGGKRLASGPLEVSPFSQSLELLKGKLNCLFCQLRDYFFYMDEDLELIEESKSYEQNGENTIPYDDLFLESKVISGEGYVPTLEDTLNIMIMDVDSLSRIPDIIEYIRYGKVVLINYKELNSELRRQFDFQLAKELLLLGTHLTHINASQIVCAGRSIKIEDSISEKKEGKIYDLEAYRRR